MKYVGAVDVGYSRTNDRKAIASLIICEYPSLEVVYEDYHQEDNVEFPYVPGHLGLKEIPLYQILFDRLQ